MTTIIYAIFIVLLHCPYLLFLCDRNNYSRSYYYFYVTARRKKGSSNGFFILHSLL